MGPGAPLAHESLAGVRVALLEARRESELASLVRRHGGEPVSVPALREVARECRDEVRAAVAALAQPGGVAVIATGAGLGRWLAVAQELGLASALREGLAHATVVCRGPKPLAVLKREGLSAHVRAAPPHTTAELLAALAALAVHGHDLVFVHDGGGSRAVPTAMAGRGARVFEVQPYAWALPEDPGALRSLVATLVAGGVDALAITTQVQVAHLFGVARDLGEEQPLRQALRERVVVAAIGPTSARALEQLGAPAHVVPESSKMGALVLALARHMASRGPGRPV